MTLTAKISDYNVKTNYDTTNSADYDDAPLIKWIVWLKKIGHLSESNQLILDAINAYAVATCLIRALLLQRLFFADFSGPVPSAILVHSTDRQ